MNVNDTPGGARTTHERGRHEYERSASTVDVLAEVAENELRMNGRPKK